jgi:hypothetical protein
MPLLQDESEKRIAAKQSTKAIDKNRYAPNLSMQRKFVALRSGEAVEISFFF